MQRAEAGQLVEHERQDRHHGQQLGGAERDVDGAGRPCVQQRAVRELVEQRRHGAKERHHGQQLEHQRPAPDADPRRLIGTPALGLGGDEQAADDGRRASRELGIPLGSIAFEMAAPGADIYTVEAADAAGKTVFTAGFSPRTREIPLSSVLPEWGTAKVTTGWLRIVAGGSVVCDQPLQTDLEKFWDFYQRDVLAAAVAHVRKKTGGEPTFSKQPYFKRLLVDLHASEPDYRIGLDEEMISSLEAVHDEIYFDTLDLFRGITRFDPEDKDTAADTSRSSAPGNVFPSLHPSLEGGPAKVRVVLEDWPAPVPEIVLGWKEKGREGVTRKIAFPALKAKETRASELVFDGRAGRVSNVVFESEWEKEADYLALVELAATWRKLFDAGLVADPFRFPGLDAVTLRPRYQSQEKDERFPALPAGGDTQARGASGQEGPSPRGGSPARPDERIVTTRDIISPDMAGDIVRRLSALDGVRSYVGGRSYEGRDVPVLELFLPLGRYVSLPRLVTFKPTLQAVARQHANEVSSTSYLLRSPSSWPAMPPPGRRSRRSISSSSRWRTRTGRRSPSSCRRTSRSTASTPDATARSASTSATRPGRSPCCPRPRSGRASRTTGRRTSYLNLHGYPSHEWVQPFSNYSPYLFRDYWIPKGWFTYFKTLSLPIYEEHREAGAAAGQLIAAELCRRPRDRRIEPDVLRPVRPLGRPLGAAPERPRAHRRGQYLRQAQGPDREPDDAPGADDVRRADARAHGRDGDRRLARVPLRPGPGLSPGPRQVPRPGGVRGRPHRGGGPQPDPSHPRAGPAGKSGTRENPGHDPSLEGIVPRSRAGPGRLRKLELRSPVPLIR